jgi:4-amino-4-deoxy-L-arabinose transferase-like glycosyltransferase
VLTYLLFWFGSEPNRRWWFVPASIAAGLAMLTKGPIGLAMPFAVISLYWMWNGELKRWLDWRVLTGIAVFVLTAGPWFALVTADTRGVYARKFFLRENLDRFTTPMENHRGPIFYHAALLFVLFAPYSIYLLGSLRYGWKAARDRSTDAAAMLSRPHRFLLCWIAVYLVFFSVAATKLPNYVLPLYPAVALLTASFVVRWAKREVSLPNWLMPMSAVGMMFVGVVTIVGLLIAGGVIPITAKFHVLNGLERWAILGVTPLIAGVIMWFLIRRDRRPHALAVSVVASTLFTASLAAWPSVELDRHKAAKQMIAELKLNEGDQEVSLYSLNWFQPSLVYYSQREVQRLDSLDQMVRVLKRDTPVVVFMGEKLWDEGVGAEIQRRVPNATIVGKRFDVTKNQHLIAVSVSLSHGTARRNDSDR